MNPCPFWEFTIRYDTLSSVDKSKVRPSRIQDFHKGPMLYIYMNKKVGVSAYPSLTSDYQISNSRIISLFWKYQDSNFGSSLPYYMLQELNYNWFITICI